MDFILDFEESSQESLFDGDFCIETIEDWDL